jgi:hypothetical protein
MKNIIGSPFHTTCELSSCRQEKSEECCMGENLAKVCAALHREHPCEHSAVQFIKCRFRCSHPRAESICGTIGSSAVASKGENLAKVCEPPYREHPLEHSAVQSVKCRFRCSHPRANFVCRAMWSSAKASVGENLAKVCAAPHREHPSEHPASKHIKCRFRCSHPRANFVCRAMWNSAKASVGENLARVCAPPHREHPLEYPAFQRVKCRFRCSHPQAKSLCGTIGSSAVASKGENLAKVCAALHREHPLEHSAVQLIKSRSRCSHPLSKLRQSLAINRQPIWPIRRNGPIITPSRPRRRLKPSSFGPFG